MADLTARGERGRIRGMFDQDQAVTLIAGGDSLRQAAKKLGCSASHICETAAQDPKFGERYARAMQIRAEADVAELPVLRKRMLKGEITPEQARVAADLIKWPASKRLPKVYGDRIQQDIDQTLRVIVDDPTSAAVTVTATVLPPALPHDE